MQTALGVNGQTLGGLVTGRRWLVRDDWGDLLKTIDKLTAACDHLGWVRLDCSQVKSNLSKIGHKKKNFRVFFFVVVA